MGTVRVNKRIANCIRDLNDGGFFQTPLRLGVVARSLAKLDVENALQVLQGVADAASSDPSTHENPTAKVLLEAALCVITRKSRMMKHPIRLNQE